MLFLSAQTSVKAIDSLEYNKMFPQKKILEILETGMVSGDYSSKR
jgi:hypothetical protein